MTISSSIQQPSSSTEKVSIKGVLGIIFMIGLLIFIPVVVASVTLPFLIEWPLSFYLSTDITHLTETYSYKPGSRTTEYSYYYRQADGGFKELFTLVPLALATLFYVAVVIIGFNLNALWKKVVNTIKGKKDKQKEPIKRLKLIPFMIIALAMSPHFLFKLPEFQQWFMAVEQPDFFSQSSLLRFNDTGKMVIWQVLAQPLEKTKLIIEDKKIVSKNKSLVNITAVNPITAETIFSLTQENEIKDIRNIKVFNGKNHLWFINEKPFYLSKIAENGKITQYKSMQEFINRESGEKFEVYKYDLRNNGEVFIRSALDDRYVFNIYNESIVSQSNYKRQKENELLTGKFYISNNRDSGVLYSKAKNSTSDWKKKLIRPSLLFSDQDHALVFHAQSLQPNNEKILSLFNAQGEQVWQQTLQLTERTVSENYYKAITAKLMLDENNNFIISMSFNRFSTHYVALEKESGKILWRYEG